MRSAQHTLCGLPSCHQALQFLLGLLSLACTLASEEELLIGWKGDTYQPNATFLNEDSKPPQRRWIETIAWEPRAFVFHGLLTHEECDHLVKLAEPKVYRSMVVDSKTGQSKLDDIRTSYGAAIMRGETPVIAVIEEKIAEWTHLPANLGEPIQVLKYVDGQKYDAHWDWFDDPVHQSAYLRDGNRLATVLLYLSEVEEGGETALPLATDLDPSKPFNFTGYSECAAKQGRSIKPVKGDALLFWDLKMDAKTGERKALHASCPTLKGTKWTATKWIHNKMYGGDFDPVKYGSRCEDKDPQCAKWAAEGQCDQRADLLGPGGLCRTACNDCVKCPAGDVLCMRKNLHSQRTHLQAGKGH